MKRWAGFTLIELLITLTIMVVLVTIAVISLRTNQQNARDEKRKTDIAALAQQLEAYYTSGSDPSSTYPPGEYPPTSFMNSESAIKITLRDLDSKVLRAPDVADAAPISLSVAPDANPPSPTTSSYIYQPLTSSGAICQSSAQECRRFNLYYKLETNSTTQVLMSKNQ